MAKDKDIYPFGDEESSAKQILEGLISPAPAQSLVMPPPDTAPKSGPGESTPLTGNLRAAPSQATPKIAPAPEESEPDKKIRRGLAGYFSGGFARTHGDDSDLQFRPVIGAKAICAAKDGKQIPFRNDRKEEKDGQGQKQIAKPARANSAALPKGTVITLADGSRGTVSYFDPNMRIARVRMEDGRKLTLRQNQLKVSR